MDLRHRLCKRRQANAANPIDLKHLFERMILSSR